MFRKKAVHNDASADTKSEHKIANFGSISSIFKGNSNDPKNDSVSVIQPDDLSSIPEIDMPKTSNSKAVNLIQEVQKPPQF